MLFVLWLSHAHLNRNSLGSILRHLQIFINTIPPLFAANFDIKVMIISSSRMSTALSIPDSFDTGNASVPFSDTVKNLGVTLDCHLSLKTHVLNFVRTANFELCRISSICRLLTTEATATLVSAFFLSRLD